MHVEPFLYDLYRGRALYVSQTPAPTSLLTEAGWSEYFPESRYCGFGPMTEYGAAWMIHHRIFSWEQLAEIRHVGPLIRGVSQDLRLGVFSSGDFRVLLPDTNGFSDVYLCNWETSTISRLTDTPQGAQANGNSSAVALSADGNKVLVTTTATNLGVELGTYEMLEITV